MTETFSFSVHSDESYRVKTYLEGLKEKGIPRSKWIANAVIRQIEYEEEQARRPQQKPLVVSTALAACTVGGNNGNGKVQRQLTEDELDEQRLMAMRSQKYALIAHRQYHKPEIERLSQFEELDFGDRLLMAFYKIKMKNCDRCRESYNSKREYYRSGHYRYNRRTRLMTEEEEVHFIKEMERMSEKYDGIDFSAEEQYLVERRKARKEQFERELREAQQREEEEEQRIREAQQREEEEQRIRREEFIRWKEEFVRRQDMLENERQELEQEKQRLLNVEKQMQEAETEERNQMLIERQTWLLLENDGIDPDDPQKVFNQQWVQKWEDYRRNVVEPYKQRYQQYKHKQQELEQEKLQKETIQSNQLNQSNTMNIA